LAKVWKKLQRADSDFTGNVTGTFGSKQLSDFYRTDNKPTKSDVGLSNVDNVQQYSASNKPTKSDVGLGNIDNSKFDSSGKFKGELIKTDGTSVFNPSTGDFTGKIDGTDASTVKSKAEDAKDAIDGNASITMVGGSLSIGTESGGVYPFSVDSSGNLKILNDEFQALADGTVNCKGSFTINQDSSSNSKITLAGSGSGTAEVEVQGANPTFDLGGASPLGTSTLHLKRGATSNQARIQFRTGSSGSEFTIGNSNNSGLQTQYAIHHGPLWSSGTADERALSFDADGKMGMYANSKSVAGFTFGSDGTNKHVYIKNGGLSVGTTTVTDGDIRCTDLFTSGNVTATGDLYSSGDLTVTGQTTFEDSVQFDGGLNATSGVDCGGTLDASGQQALTGWHTKDKIWIPPSAWIVNDDNAYGNLAMVDNGGYAKVMYSAHEAYASIPIPSGYKVTHFRINGTASVTITASYSAVNSSTTTSCQPPTQIYTNTEYSCYTSAVNADDTNGRYIVLGWYPSTTSQYLHGGYLKIAKI